MERGDVWWASLPEPRGSEPGFRRPVLVVQAQSFLASRLATVTVAVITSRLALAEAPGNVLLSRQASGLPKRSVVDVSQVLTLDRRLLTEKAGRLPRRTMAAVDDGLRLALGV